jgi:hypothetical protein
MISSTDIGSDSTFTGLDVQTNLGTDNVDLICIRGSQHFVITTDQTVTETKYAALIGNRAGNIKNRYHSVNATPDGYTVADASWHLEGYTLTLTKAGSRPIFQTVILDGPKIVYTGAEVAEQQVALKRKLVQVQLSELKSLSSSQKLMLRLKNLNLSLFKELRSFTILLALLVQYSMSTLRRELLKLRYPSLVPSLTILATLQFSHNLLSHLLELSKVTLMETTSDSDSILEVGRSISTSTRNSPLLTRTSKLILALEFL